jgi:pyrroloquinoline quinone biosynthesis protein B
MLIRQGNQMMKILLRLTVAISVGVPLSTPVYANTEEVRDCNVEFMVLGIGQDGGAPQIDRQSDPGWTTPALRLFAASGALVDHRNNKRYLFEATPDIREQLYALNDAMGVAGNSDPLGLAGVFLTHAHIGHYAGLMFAGHESAGSKELKVFAMPRMKAYLESNGPWDQLVRYSNIILEPLRDGTRMDFGDAVFVTPHRVPHRDEYSETVGFVVNGPSKSVLFLPDIDDWDQWEQEFGARIEDMIAAVDFAYLDATFFDDNELPGRDMSDFPHPRLFDSMQRFSKLSPGEQDKVRFFHINHTNRVRFEDSREHQLMNEMGFHVARQGERVCLD